MKKWLQDHFLPMWAKQTLLWEKRQLEAENKALQQQVQRLEAYIDGMKAAMRSGKRIQIVNRGGEV